jgi:hypothetical protein
MAIIKRKTAVVVFQPKQVGISEHDRLCLRAEKWLNQINCKVAIRDPFRASTREHPDAIGWRDGVSILIECKASREDFLADKNKAVERHFTTVKITKLNVVRFCNIITLFPHSRHKEIPSDHTHIVSLTKLHRNNRTDNRLLV